MKTTKRFELICRFAAQVREYHRRGDRDLRSQAEENLRAVASRARADKILAGIYGKAVAP